MSLPDADVETWLYVHGHSLAHIVPQQPRLNWGTSQTLCGALVGIPIGPGVIWPLSPVCQWCEHFATAVDFDMARFRTTLDREVEMHNNQVVTIGQRSYREYFRWVRAPRINPDDAKHIALYRETIAERGGSYFAADRIKAKERNGEPQTEATEVVARRVSDVQAA